MIIARANEGAKAEISADGKRRRKAKKQNLATRAEIARAYAKPKRHSVAATRPLLKNQMPLSLLP